jgi:uncharacterized protein (DUF488 family)
MPVAFYTIGHSTHGIEEFVRLLRSVGVQFLVDVRTILRSRRNSQFNRDVLPATLADFQIGYKHWRLSAAFDPSATSRPQ